MPRKGNKNAKMRAWRSMSKNSKKAVKGVLGSSKKAKMKAGGNLRRARKAAGKNPNTGLKTKRTAKVKRVAAKVQKRQGGSLSTKQATQRARRIIRKRKK